MAVEIRFEKHESNISWGFRLTGGTDYDAPLTVVKVTEESLAEEAGLLVDDVVVRINDIPTVNLTHAEAHDLILDSGNLFVFGIRRGDADDYKISNDSEICSILEQTDSLSDETIQGMLYSEETLANSEVLKTIKSEKAKKELTEEQKKWSTFLQKPKNAKPKSQKLIEEEANKAPPYRVIITKQKKRDLSKREVKKEPTTEVEEILCTINGEQETEEIAEVTEYVEDRNDEGNEEENIVSEDVDDNNNENVEQEREIENEDGEEISRVEYSEKDIPRQAPTLEEQLAEVQRQLLALSQLPSTIQVTLNAVTQQLQQIVKNSLPHEECDDEYGQTNEDNTMTEEDMTEDTEDKAETILEVHSAEQEDVVEEEEVVEEEFQEEVDTGPTEEELEQIKLEEEKLEKQKKAVVRNPLTPLARPIILPGGRRWSQADDGSGGDTIPATTLRASLAAAAQRMSDDRITRTLNACSEVVVGHTLGINFKKYQPPPKSLTHLENSEVYRMIHDMEPPERGIVARTGKCLAEEDYYVEKESRDSPDPAQLER